MKKILTLSNGIFLVITIAVNYLSNTGLLNGNTMKSISEKYFNLFTPAGYAFSIWGVIYLGLIGFVFYTTRSLFKKEIENNSVVIKIGWWFVVSCLANSLWVIAWLYEYTGISVLLMVVLLFSLLKIIVNTRMELDEHPFKKYLFIFWPFAIYSGWVSVALIANIAAWLTKSNWNGWGISEVSWTVIMIGVAGLINIMMIRLRNLREYAIVGIWALLAIAVSNNNHNGNTTIIYASIGMSALVLVFVVISGMKTKGRSFSKM